MKIIFRTAAAVLILLTTSCSKDDSSSNDDQLDQEVALLEETPLDANIISDNVVINGGTKQQGAPPTPNEAISLDISGTSRTAFLGEGFDVSLSSDASIVGAYLRFKSNDGTVADSFYDVNIDANTITDKSGKALIKRRKKTGLLKAKVDGTTLDVDFNNTIEPGTFCYEICVYDTEGNISAPQEVCLTVESWGGNASLVASWDLTRYTETYEDETANISIGEEECSDEVPFTCDQGGEYMATYYCYTTQSFTIEFKQDGTYTSVSTASGKTLDYDSSNQSCEAIYDEYDDERYESSGNWSYVQDGKRIILIEYSYSETYDGETYTGTNEIGDEEVLLDGTLEVNGNSLVITEEDVDYKGVYYFQK